jgi:hypothetical protein
MAVQKGTSCFLLPAVVSFLGEGIMNVTFTMGSLVLTLLIGLSGAADAREQAPFRIDKNGVQFGASLDPRQHGYEHAYRDGADRGRFDREHGVRYNLNAKDYNDSTRGYERFMGNKGQYQQGYREGYKAGYDSAYHGVADQYGRIYGRTEENRNQTQPAVDPYASRRWGATDLAFDVGYRDGVTSGQYDRGRNVRADFENTDGYRNANHGYGKSYGQSAAYQTQYRTGFQRGYQDGYGHSR